MHELKHGDPLRVLAAVRALPAQAEQARETRDGVVSYLDKRRSQISYAEFQTAGYPIGSGIVESGNNLVVEVRLKGSGMHWLRTNVNPMLALRCALCSDRWSEAWGFIWQGLGDNGQSSVADGDRRNAPLPRMPSPSSHRPGSLLPRSRRFQNFGLKEPWSTAAPPPLIHGTAVPFHGRAVPLLRAQNFRGHPSGGGPGPFPDIQSYAVRDYGNRVGMWRLADALSKHGVRATVALNSDICRYEPEIISMGMELGWEWMGHGRTNAERLRGLEVDAERALVQDVVQIITGATGKRPRGWLSPGRAQTENTPDLLAEAGFGLPR